MTPNHGDFSYLGKSVSKWTEAEVEHAWEAHNRGDIVLHAKDVLPVVEVRIEAAKQNRMLIQERTERAKEKRLLLQFVDTSSKPEQSIDTRSVKHSIIDATSKPSGGIAVMIATMAGAYEWLCNHPELTRVLFKIPTVVIIAIVVAALGWWGILFAKRLDEKWHEKH